MSRPVDWSPLADSDPVPGQPEVVEQAGRRYCMVAVAIDEAAAKLRRIAGNQDMKSHAVDAFRSEAETVADNITPAHDRYAATGQALSGYAPQQHEAQTESLHALWQAKRAEQELQTAHRLMAAAQARIDAAPPGTDTAADRGDYRRAEAAADDASAALAAARRRLQSAIDIRDAAAQRAMGGITEVVEGAELNDGWWDNWGAKVVKIVVKIADVVALVAGILTMVAVFIPVIGPALAAALQTIALIAGLVSLLGNIALAATGERGWSAAAISALGVVTFGLGRAAARGLKTAVKGARGASRATAGSWAAKSPAWRAVSRLSDSSNARTAVRTMMGGTDEFADRAAAVRALKDSDELGLVRFGREFARSYSPRNLADSLGSARPSRLADDLGDEGLNFTAALRQTPSDVMDTLRDATGKSGMLRALGQADAANQLDSLKAINPVIRNSDDIISHLKQVNRYSNAVTAAASTNWGVNSYQMAQLGVAPNTAAANLNLGNSGQVSPELSGAGAGR